MIGELLEPSLDYMGLQTIETLEGKGPVLTRPSTISKGHWTEPPTLTITKVQNRWRKQWQKSKDKSGYMHTCREPIGPLTRVVVITNYSLSPWLLSARFSVLDTTFNSPPRAYSSSCSFLLCSSIYKSLCTSYILRVSFKQCLYSTKKNNKKKNKNRERERERERERGLVWFKLEEKKS